MKAALVLALCLGGSAALAQSGKKKTQVQLRVVEVAGERAYFTPGEKAGLRAGQTLVLGGRRYPIAAATADTVSIEIEPGTVREGDRATAEVVRAVGATGALPPPLPLSRFAGQWREPVRPAEVQRPAAVPLGAAVAAGPVRAVLWGALLGLLPSGEDAPGSAARLEVGARVVAEPFRESPFGLDLDGALRAFAGLGDAVAAQSRPFAVVRELRLRWGEPDDPLAAAGRLRWAAAGVGLLDGARVRTPAFAGVTVGAFGGFVPDPRSGRPTFDASRFGVELGWRDLASSVRPILGLVIHGSRWDGALDERRLSTTFALLPGPLSLSGYGELSFFDAVNPWGAERIELTSAGLDASVALGPVRIGAHADARQPERSRFLAALLPPAWTCTATPQPAGAPPPEPCDGSRDLRASAALDGSLELRHLAFAAGAFAVRMFGGQGLDQTGAFADARAHDLPLGGRVGVGLMTAEGDLYTTRALRLTVGAAAIPDRLDLDLYWRAATITYRASLADFLEHRVGGEAMLALRADLDVSGVVEVLAGDDAQGLMVLAVMMWRPSL